MQLSKRLQAVAGMVTPGYTMADIGTDHAYVPIWLYTHKAVPHALAMDVREGPLSRARENIALYHAEACIETRLSDGLSALKEGEADSIVIAGMGGMLMRRILSDKEELLKSIKELILQPQSDREALCRYLAGTGFRITAEDMVFEEDKYYSVIKAVHGQEIHRDKVDFAYGHHLLEEKHPVLRDYLQKEYLTKERLYKKLKDAVSEAAVRRREELKEELELIRQAAGFYA